MKLHPASWFLMLVALLLSPCAANADASVMPENPTSSDSIWIYANVPGHSGVHVCDMTYDHPVVTRTGNSILIEYALRLRTEPLPPNTVCLNVPPAIYALVGQLQPGTYDVRIVGSTLGEQNPDQTMSLLVANANGAPNSPWNLTINPEHPTTADSIHVTTLVFEAGRNLCDLIFPFEKTVTRNGSSILVEYEIKERTEADPPPEGACVSTLVPIPFDAEIGRLPAGQYEVSVIGSTAGEAMPRRTTEFTVVRADGTPDGGPQDTVQVPTNATWALASLLALMFGFAAVRLRSR